MKPFLGGTTKVDSDERTGKLIIVTREENIETLKFVIETFDAPVKMKTTSKLFKLQHAESKEIQGILDEVIKNQQRIKQQLQGKNVAARAQADQKSPAGVKVPGGQKPAAGNGDVPQTMVRVLMVPMNLVILLPSHRMKEVMPFWSMVPRRI